MVFVWNTHIWILGASHPFLCPCGQTANNTVTICDFKKVVMIFN